MNKKLLALLALLLTMMLVLAACNSDEDTSKPADEPDKTEDGGEKEEDGAEENAEEPASDDLFSVVLDNEGEAIKGGTLQVALVNDSPFQGIFSYTLYEDAYDSEIMAYSSNVLFDTDGDFLISDGGIATLDVDEASNKATIKIQEGVKWSDGEPLKIEDLIQPYLIIGHPDYAGVRYDSDFQNIVGAVEYHDGKADTISGLKKVDETTLEISFNKVSPAIYSGGDGLWFYAEPSHIVKDIPVAELLESDAVRKNPVTLGAFKFDKIVPGETVQFVRNDNYWKGQAKLDGVVIKTVPTASAAKALETGEYDLALSFPTSAYENVKDLENISLLGRQELYYSYVGFKLGKYDYDASLAITNEEEAKMGDKVLRQAMGYALDIEQVNEVFYFDLRERANSLIPPVFKSFHDASIEGYNYDPEKAKKLLDDAGYKDTDGDGLREDPKGEKLSIKLAAMAGDETQEQVISYYLQNWGEVGLDVQLATGRLIEFNTFYDKVQADDPEIDVFMGAWGTGTNPSPAGLYSKTAVYNFSRYTSEDLEGLLTAIDSPEAIDGEFRAKKFREWQEYMQDVSAVIPMQFRYELLPINDRVKNWDFGYDTDFDYIDIELVADTPVK
ncbi:peptide/nickel transport system substrate-binding protein [Psychrobacillus psychrotolerans]|uniref:Peptide/nickel transport system substrate-binding protein n=1 Tax=Psychrobacillus psychrotolerans TaxID=126156 RepID=A0A1I5WWF9_9BACI|nr:oligopeptide ABC transporter substrate-binding protein [Psychrobacillus psychrotolerans]SFQ23951.1 peptide/nickel transport system substrate-binding protein [Psychrobacillus psychrotolerans]